MKTTVVGGLIFLIPVILLVLVLKHAMAFAAKVAKPIAERFPIPEIGGPALVTLVAIMVLIFVAFLAGLAARTSPGRRIAQWFEDSMLSAVPQYRMMKSMAQGFAQLETAEDLLPVLVRLDDGWQLGYQVEELQDGPIVVFLPAAPTPMSGNVLYVTADRVSRLDIGIGEAMKIVKRMGLGSAAALKDARLTTPGV
jgi:uncharacterized membrane protein